MARSDDISACLTYAAELLEEITSEYERSLEKRAVSQTLAVKIKSYLENLRSPLDFLASEIAEKRLVLGSSHRCYFPVACENLAAFQAHMLKNLPNLSETHHELYQAIEAVQHFTSGGCKALPKLSKLVNENKHNRFSEQTKTEQRTLKIDFPGGSGIRMGPGSSITGSGMISSGGGAVILTGDSISGDQPARKTRNVKQTVEVWVSFSFHETGDNVLSLLRHCLDDVERIVTDLSPRVFT